MAELSGEFEQDVQFFADVVPSKFREQWLRQAQDDVSIGRGPDLRTKHIILLALSGDAAGALALARQSLSIGIVLSRVLAQLVQWFALKGLEDETRAAAQLLRRDATTSPRQPSTDGTALALSQIAYAHALIGDGDIAMQRVKQALSAAPTAETETVDDTWVEVYGRSAATLTLLSDFHAAEDIVMRLHRLWNDTGSRIEDRVFAGAWLAWGVAEVQSLASRHNSLIILTDVISGTDPAQILRETLSVASQIEPVDRQSQRLLETAYTLPLTLNSGAEYEVVTTLHDSIEKLAWLVDDDKSAAHIWAYMAYIRTRIGQIAAAQKAATRAVEIMDLLPLETFGDLFVVSDIAFALRAAEVLRKAGAPESDTQANKGSSQPPSEALQSVADDARVRVEPPLPPVAPSSGQTPSPTPSPRERADEAFQRMFEDVHTMLLGTDDDAIREKLDAVGRWVSTRRDLLSPAQSDSIIDLAKYAWRLNIPGVADALFQVGLDTSQGAPEAVLAYLDFIVGAQREDRYEQAYNLFGQLYNALISPDEMQRVDRLRGRLDRLDQERLARSETRPPGEVSPPPPNIDQGAANRGADVIATPPPVVEVPASIAEPEIAHFECTICLSRDKVELLPRGPGLGGQPRDEFQLDTTRLNQASDIEQYGAILFEALFFGRVRQAYHHALEAAKNHASPAPLHLRLQIDPSAPEYHLLLWEYLYDPDPGRGIRYIAGSPTTPFSRFLVHDAKPPELGRTDTLRILFAVADPIDLGNRSSPNKIYRLPRLDVATDIEVIRSAVNAMQPQLQEQGMALEYDILTPDKAPVTLSAIHERLQIGGYHVLHVVAHGVSDGGMRQLILEDDNHRARPYDARSFAREIDPSYGVQLVFLGACLSGQQSEADAYAGLAAQLVQHNVPAVVAMLQKVSFETVHEFTQLFYTHLAYHGVVDKAMNAARRAMYAGEDWNRIRNTREWAIPVLFMRSEDGRLFDTGRAPQSLEQPQYKVEHRTFEVSLQADLERAVGDLVGEIGSRVAQRMHLSTTQQQAVEQRLLQIAHSPPPEAQAEQARPLVFRTDPSRRTALLAAVQDYRAFPWRRHVLILRAFGRREALAKLRSVETLDNDAWQALLTQGQVEVGGSPWQIADGGPDTAPAEAELISPRKLREKLRATPATIVPAGNLTWTTTQPLPPWNDDLARAVRDLLVSQGAPEVRVIQAEPIPLEVAATLLHLAAPGQVAPYDRDWARRVQTWFGDPRLPQEPSYQEWLSLVQEMLSDEGLDFDDLPDVVFFLQQVAQLHRLDAPGRPAVAVNTTTPRPAIPVPLALEPHTIDSRLDLPEHTFPSLTAALNAGKHVILTGPPGTGKTTLAEDMCRHATDRGFCRGVVSVTATADWTTFDTIGGYMPAAGGELLFRPGVFLRAIRENKWLLIDEINRADIDKAFGELFSVLSGQGVTLPYDRGGTAIRILPPGEAPQSDNDYVVHPNWRIIGTMNVYDKASLFAMSYAFMRRFAFIEVELPGPALYQQLIRAFVARHEGLADEAQERLAAQVWKIFNRDSPEQWPLMRHRALGPAFARDMVAYLAMRLRTLQEQQNELSRALAEAFNLYAISQLDGLDRDAIAMVYGSLHRVFDTMADSLIRPRLQELFPHIAVKEWHQALEQARRQDEASRDGMRSPASDA